MVITKTIHVIRHYLQAEDAAQLTDIVVSGESGQTSFLVNLIP